MGLGKKDVGPLVLVAILVAIFAFIVGEFLFKSPSHTSSAATAPTISSKMPDAYHDSTYTSIFNAHALDPARPVSVGSSSNSTPFQSH